MEDLKEFKVNAQAIAYLLNARKGQSFSVMDAKGMIARIVLGKDLRKDDEGRIKEYGSGYISVGDFEDAYKHHPIKRAIESMRKSYLTHLSTYNYIMDYPQNKMDASTKPIKKISIPSGLREILTSEQKLLIISKWQKRYRGYGVEF